MKRFALGSLAFAAALATPALAVDPVPTQTPPTQPSTAELQEQIRQLQTKVQQLEGRQTELNSQVVTDTVERVLRDSEKRSKLLQTDGSLTAGFVNDQFIISSTDGNWSLIPHVLMQFRNVTNWNTAEDDDVENGFELRRTKFGFDGTAVTKDLYYRFQWDVSRSTGTTSLDDAFVRYTFDKEHGYQVKAGQYKDPWFKEELIGDNRQLAVERSLLNSLIAGGVTLRVQGVSLIQEAEMYRAEIMYHDGYNSVNTNFQDGSGGSAYIAGGTNFGVAGRFDWYFTEKSKQVDDFTAHRNKQDLLVAGAGFDWTQGGDNDVLFHTVDVQWENAQGLGVYGAFAGAYRDLVTGAAGGALPAGTFYDWGLLGQLGYVLPDTNWELFGRYDVTFLDDEALPAGSEDTVHEITGGANYYFYKHNVKLTLDASWLPNGSPTPQTGLGVVAGDDDQFIIRGQLQLYL